MKTDTLPAPQIETHVLHKTTSLCKVCKNALPAEVVATLSGEVWMRKTCEQHGPQEVRISTDSAWYLRTRAIQPHRVSPDAFQKTLNLGCPFDCGLCPNHGQETRLPIITITSACDLNCPICYVHNKNEDAYYMDRDAFKAILERLRKQRRELDILNFTGGEPTTHPHLLEFLELAQKAGVHRVTICSNGVRLAQDETLVRELARLGTRVALSFDSFEKEADHRLQGVPLLDLKLQCLELLEKHGVDVTLIPVMTKGVNDHEIGRILALAFQKPNIRHIEVHTLTFTGQGGVSFDRSGRITMREVLQRIEETTSGLLCMSDFVSSPCTHPLCYQIAYLLVDPMGGPPVPFAHFVSPEALHEALSDRLYLEPTPRMEHILHNAIDRLWIEGGEEAERILRLLKHLLAGMFPSNRTLTRTEALRVAEQSVKAVYVHSHMDEETFDVERAALCCNSTCHDNGTAIPVCSYNVLYREKEPRFVTQPRSWNDRKGGQTCFRGMD